MKMSPWPLFVFLAVILHPSCGSEQGVCQQEPCTLSLGEKAISTNINVFDEEKTIPESSLKEDVVKELEDINQAVVGETFEEVESSWDKISNYIANNENIFYTFLVIMIGFLWSSWNKKPHAAKLLGTKLSEEDFTEAGDYVRPLCRMEYMFAIGGIPNSFCTHQAIWIRSKSPIDEKVMKNAIIKLTRQYPFLQLRLAFRYYDFWFKRIENMTIDFTTVEGDATEEFRKVLNLSPKLFKGPLWKVKLVKCVAGDNAPGGRKFQATLIFSVAHILTDANTNNTICREAIRIYNQIISNEFKPSTPVRISTPFGKEYPTIGILDAFKQLVTGMTDYFKETFIVKCLVANGSHQSDSRIVLDEISEDETAKLIAICKRKKITVNSLVTSISALAFVQSAAKFSDYALKKMEVNINQAIDIRRYAVVEEDNLNGCYLSFITTFTRIDSDNEAALWNEIQRMQELLNKNH